MKILCLRISGFGKFHDRRIDFKDGLNLVQGDNESGKSTIHAFIRAMLFGAEKKQGRAAKDDFYSRYEPWDAPSDFKGSMDFEHDGHIYRIARSLYKSEKSVKLTDLETGEELPLPTGTITSLIPELTESAFRNTISSEQQNIKPGADLSDQVQNHIANLSLAKTNEVNFSGAINELETRKKTLKKQILTLGQQEQRLTEELNESELTAERNAAKEDRLGVLCSEADKLENSIKEKRKTLDILRERKPERILEEHGITRPDASDSEEQERVKEREEEAVLLEVRRASEGVMSARKDEAEAISGRISELIFARKKTEKLAAAAGALGLILCIVGNNRYQAALFAGVFLVLVCAVALFFVLLFNREEKENKEKAEEIKLAAEQEAAGVRDRILTEYADRCARRTDTVRSELTAYYDELARLSDEIKYETDVISEELETLTEKLHANEVERAEITGILSNNEDVDLILQDKKNELSALRMQIEKAETDSLAMELALTSASGLSDEIRKGFGRGLNKRLSELTALITAGAYTEVRIDRDMNVEVMDKVDFVPLEKLSVGTVEQIRLALRLAVSELLYRGCEVPVMLDESFAFCDDKRLSEILKLICGYPGQIILFSCSSRERRLCEECGITVNIIEL